MVTLAMGVGVAGGVAPAAIVAVEGSADGASAGGGAGVSASARATLPSPIRAAKINRSGPFIETVWMRRSHGTLARSIGEGGATFCGAVHTCIELAYQPLQSLRSAKFTVQHDEMPDTVVFDDEWASRVSKQCCQTAI